MNPGITAKQICSERSEGLRALKGLHFDLIIDFICYKESDLIEVFQNVKTNCFLMISSTWVPRLWGGNNAWEIGQDKNISDKELPIHTFKYLMGKLDAENSVIQSRYKGLPTSILRLPIMLGDGDHTGRLNFYLERFYDQNPIILVDGGMNLSQIADVDDLAMTMTDWCMMDKIMDYAIWDGLPGLGGSVASFLLGLNKSLGMNSEFISISSQELSECLPNYLINEPFWREHSIGISESNIYQFLNRRPASFRSLSLTRPINNVESSELRIKEIEFLIGRKNA
jgi:hypothetical protein